jgi:hypothetical protein
MTFERSNQFIRIDDWMTQLNLDDLTELVTFAIVYSFTVSRGEFRGSSEYLASRMLCSRKTAFNKLKSLTEKNLILKRSVSKTNVNYRVNEAEIERRLSKSEKRTEEKKQNLKSKKPFNELKRNDTDFLRDENGAIDFCGYDKLPF